MIPMIRVVKLLLSASPEGKLVSRCDRDDCLPYQGDTFCSWFSTKIRTLESITVTWFSVTAAGIFDSSP